MANPTRAPRIGEITKGRVELVARERASLPGEFLAVPGDSPSHVEIVDPIGTVVLTMPAQLYRSARTRGNSNREDPIPFVRVLYASTHGTDPNDVTLRDTVSA